MIQRAIKRTSLGLRPCIQRREAPRTDVELGILVKLDVDGVAGVALAQGLGLDGVVEQLGPAGSALDDPVREAERRGEVLGFAGELHGVAEGEGAVLGLQGGDGEVGG